MLSPRIAVLVLIGAVATGCGTHAAANSQADQKFVNSVYSQAPDIGGYRSAAQLVGMGQAVCSDLGSGASVQQLADRLPLVEGKDSLPPADLGVVITAAVNVLCPRFDKLLA